MAKDIVRQLSAVHQTACVFVTQRNPRYCSAVNLDVRLIVVNLMNNEVKLQRMNKSSFTVRINHKLGVMLIFEDWYPLLAHFAKVPKSLCNHELSVVCLRLTLSCVDSLPISAHFIIEVSYPTLFCTLDLYFSNGSNFGYCLCVSPACLHS